MYYVYNNNNNFHKDECETIIRQGNVQFVFFPNWAHNLKQRPVKEEGRLTSEDLLHLEVHEIRLIIF
jgi:hypothetical protein